MTALLAGIILLTYGGIFRTTAVVKGPVGTASPLVGERADKRTDVLRLSEFHLVKDVTIGGMIRWDSGILQRTYGGNVKPADFCPT